MGGGKTGSDGGGGLTAAAFSGGPDSTALLLLHRPDLALIVDHGLRADSAHEAEVARARATALGIRAQVLRWTDPKPATGVMEAARAARYALLLEACHHQGYPRLLLGHHQDDQIETVLMRRARSSGWRGLAGMPTWAERAGIRVERPLLAHPKEELIGVCRENGVSFVNDPSNHNPVFTRARVRAGEAASLPAHARRDLLEEIARARYRREAEIVRLAGRFHAMGGACDPYGTFCVEDSAQLFSADREEDLHLLTLLLMWGGQPDHPPRRDAVDALFRDLAEQTDGAFTGRTLAGCRIILEGRRRLWIARETGGGRRQDLRPLDFEAGEYNLLWDRRCRIRGTEGAPFTLAPVGEGTAWRAQEALAPLHERPGAVRAAVPALWRAGQMIGLAPATSQPLFHPLRQGFGEITPPEDPREGA